MKEKERYECKYNEKLMKHYTFDNENKEELGYKGVVRVLNQQDARIKELEKENQQLKKQISKIEETHKHIMSGEYIPANVAEKSLKLSEQSQKQLAIEELEKIKQLLVDCRWFQGENEYDFIDDFAVNWTDLIEVFDKRIKSLKGEH